MKTAIVLFFLLLTTEAFAMNPMSDLAVKLKTKGYPQALVRGDNVYLTKLDQYAQFDGNELVDEYVKVPQLVNLISNLNDVNYSLKHEYQGQDKGEIKELWTISDDDIQISNASVWVVMSKFWILKKGLK